jgi:hypothetical protein
MASSWKQYATAAATTGGAGVVTLGAKDAYNANSGKGGKKWTTGNVGEKGRKEFEKITGLDDSDIAKGFDAGKMFNPNVGSQSPFRNQQSALAQMLMQRANGQAPSMTDAIANQQQMQGISSINAQTKSNRGVNAALAARGSQMASANLGAQLAQQRMVGNLQEQQSAQNSLGGLLAQARGQDTQFTQMGLDQRNLQSQAMMQEAMQRRQLNAEGIIAARGARQKNFENQQNFAGQMMGGAGGAMMMSDERSKENIQDISKEDLNEFFTAFKPKTFNYKDTTVEGTSEGERIGFVLQDVANTKLGKKLIRTNKDGMLMYDRDNLQGILLAALAYSA